MTSIYIKADTQLPERHENDLYITELGLIRAAYRHFLPYVERSTKVLDVGAGDGRWGRLVREVAVEPPSLSGVEISDVPPAPGFDHWYTQDVLTLSDVGPFDLIVSNPPYTLAEIIVRKAWSLLSTGGSMLMLLRLAFMEGVDRYNNLWSEIWPFEVAVLSRRPSFYGAGRTNGTAFAVFHWHKTAWGEPAGRPRAWNTTLLIHER